jgi:hypothetical protein
VDIEDARAFFFPLEEVTLEGFGRSVEHLQARISGRPQ